MSNVRGRIVFFKHPGGYRFKSYTDYNLVLTKFQKATTEQKTIRLVGIEVLGVRWRNWSCQGDVQPAFIVTGSNPVLTTGVYTVEFYLRERFTHLKWRNK